MAFCVLLHLFVVRIGDIVKVLTVKNLMPVLLRMDIKSMNLEVGRLIIVENFIFMLVKELIKIVWIGFLNIICSI